MTREEKEMWNNIEKLSELRSRYSCFDEKEQPFYHALSLGIKSIKALKQESCEDAISRQAAIEAFGLSEKSRKYGGDHSGYDTLMKYEIQYILEALPPVTPQPKIGHWIDEPYYKISEYGEEDTYYTRKCSECFEKYNVVFNYCPNCGAKMEEVEE